jgi:superfamily II DNA or RNA helicase
MARVLLGSLSNFGSHNPTILVHTNMQFLPTLVPFLSVFTVSVFTGVPFSLTTYLKTGAIHDKAHGTVWEPIDVTLYIRELKLRGLLERILIVCPANLSFQWQRELKEKFDEKFLVLKGRDIRDQFGVNQWLEQSQVITSLDLAKRNEILPGLEQVHWDLVVVDEAHRMSWTPPARKTARYALGELLRDTTDHLLLMTATPHKGDPSNFSLFLQPIDADAYADVKSLQEAMEHRRAPFYLRRTKETMVYFPEHGDDGTWVARKIFTKRIPHTVDFQIDGAEFDLYRDITRFVKRQSSRAAAQEEDPRARAVGFLMSLYQRRLASSTHAVRRSLENRSNRLEEGLKKAQELAYLAPPELPTQEELEEMYN